MKILHYIDTYDSRINSIVDTLRLCNYTVGYISEMDEKSINEFDPDIIIHNIPNVSEFLCTAKKPLFISFNNSQDTTNSFTFIDENSKRYIPPFVSLKEIEVEEHELYKYQSDVVYFGSPLNQPNESKFVFNKMICFLSQNNLKFRFFNQHPHNIYGYCGMCNISEYFKHYRHSKASIVNGINDKARLQDIIVSGGNPVVFYGDVDDFHDRLKNAIYNNEKYTIDGFSKERLIADCTVFDASSQIFKTFGLNKIATDIKNAKQKVIGKYK